MQIFKPNVMKLKDKRDVEGLINALNYQKDVKIRRQAADALGEVGGVLAVESLRIACNDEDLWVAEKALNNLAKLGDMQAIELLLYIGMTDECFSRRLNAIKAMEYGGSLAVPFLIKALKNHNPELLKNVVEILGRIGDDRASEHLHQILDESNKQLHDAAQKARIGQNRAPENIQKIEEECIKSIRDAAQKALKSNGWNRKTYKDKFPASLPGSIPEIKFILLSEWKEGVGAGEDDFEKALSCLKDEDSSSAERAFKKAIESGLAPLFEAGSRMNLGKLYFQQHDIVAAVNEFQKVIFISPQRASTAYDCSTYLALIYQALEMNEDMLATIELAKKAMNHVDYRISEQAANEIKSTVREIYNIADTNTLW